MIGVLQFPGSCDERDAVAACERVGDARLVWHEETDLSGIDAVVVPGGFSYGDYLRAGAIARFSPAMEAVAAFASEGGPVLGICNGFQVLCEAGLLPGALLPNEGLRFICRQVALVTESTDSPFTRNLEAGARLSIPIKHMTGRYFASGDQLDELEGNGQVAFRYAPGENPNGSVRDIAGVTNPARNVMGLMPHPEHAVDPLTGSDDGLALHGDGLGASARIRVSAVAEPRYRELGLTDAEYGRIEELLGREPNDVELAMFSLLWSEHCAYKHSRKLLSRLPTEGDRVVMGPGENAGAVDIGGGRAVAFKVESHNHPSAVEPFQGAATGVGGILRDVFAVGARPIAVLDSLRFGELGSERSRYLFEGAVAGIGHYGNSIGVPTVGGEVYFEPPYEHNCLVNAMCVGLAETEAMIRSAAAGPGNLIVLIGASTGRDGIGGASVLASAELEAGDDAKRPSVQIGDPFEESKLLECCLELLERGLLVSLQDLGAAGLTSSAGEMASKGGVGIEIDVAKVPRREPDLEPFEVMISESQERMLAVVEPAKLDEVVEACERWQTVATAIGEVTEGEDLRVLDDGDEVADVPVSVLVDDCPLYDLEPEEPAGWMYGNEETLGTEVALSAGRSADPEDPSAIALALLGSSNLASKRWAFEQYDSIVGSRTLRRPEAADAAVLATPEAGGAIAVSIDGSGRRVACDPYAGAVEAVLECAQNLACVGAEPLGLTNCLNFGNPEKPNVAWQLDQAVSGLADACRALAIPVVGGNVSLYNETEHGPIYPTPVVGMVGELPDPGRAVGAAPSDGDELILIGPFAPSLAGSELAKLRGELDAGLPRTEVEPVAAALTVVREAVREGLAGAAHDVSEGGLACALAEMAIAGGVGIEADLDPLVELRGGSGETSLFGEGPGGVVVGTGNAGDLLERAEAAGVDALRIGRATGDRLELSAAERTVSVLLQDAERAWKSLPDRL